MSATRSRLHAVASVVAVALALAGCHVPSRPPRTTVDVGLAAGGARVGHNDSFVPLFTGTQLSHADYALFGGTAGVRYAREHGWGGTLRVASSGGVLTHAEDIYQSYGTVFDRYHVTSVTLGAVADAMRAEVAFGLSIFAGATTGDRGRERGVLAMPHAHFFFHASTVLDVGLLLGSEDGFVLDATLAAVGVRYRHEAFRLGAHAGCGTRVIPDLGGDPAEPARFPFLHMSGDFALDPLAVLEVHARLGVHAELGARYQLLGRKSQGMLVVTFRHEPARGAVHE